MSQVTISRIEHMKRAARLGEAEGLADVFGIPLSLMAAPDVRVAMLGMILDRPREARAALRRLRQAAVEVAYLWGDLELDIKYARRLRAEHPEHVLEDDAAAAFESHEIAAGQLLEMDPVAEVAAAIASPDEFSSAHGIVVDRDDG